MRFDPNKWYFKTHVYVIAFLCIGPFILPLALINPRYNLAKKVTITILTLVASYFMGVLFIKSAESILKYYQMLAQLSK